MVKDGNHTSTQVIEADEDEVQNVVIIPLSRLQEKNDTFEGYLINSPKLKSIGNKPEKLSTPRKRKATPARTPRKTGSAKMGDAATPTPTPKTSKTPRRNSRKPSAENSGMKADALLKYFPKLTKNEPKPEVSSVASTDPVYVNYTPEVDRVSDGRRNKVGPSNIEIDNRGNDSNEDSTESEGSLVLKSSSSIFITPPKSAASTSALHDPNQRLPEQASLTRTPGEESTCTAPVLGPHSSNSTPTHVRKLGFNTPLKHSQSSGSHTEGAVASQLPIPSRPLPQSEEETNDNENEQPAASSTCRVPPTQKDAEEVKRRLEAHFKRMEEHGASLSDVGIYSDLENLSSSPDTESSPKRTSTGSPDQNEDVPGKTTRRRRKTKSITLKPIRRKLSAENTSNGPSMDLSSTPRGRVDRKRISSNSNSNESESPPAVSILNVYLLKFSILFTYLITKLKLVLVYIFKTFRVQCNNKFIRSRAN